MSPSALSIVPRLVVAGVASGVGKTTTTVALCRALRARGLRVAVFKCGPDYLDPTYHARAAGAPCHTLDGWMMGKDGVLATFARAAEGFDLALIEGVMGLFDGAAPTGEAGSTAEIAKWLEAPVLLVVDASGMARTVAAIAHGFATFDPEIRLAGLVCNRVGSAGHLEILRKAVASARLPPVIGGFTKEAELAFPERHLGLRTASREAIPEARLDAWGARAEACLGIDHLLEIARGATELAGHEPAAAITRPATALAPPARSCRIGLAFDEAFHFYYEENLRLLEQLGASLVRFSPLADARLPDVDGLYLGGGYPEVHAEALAGNASMRAAVAAFARASGPIYAECGGLMYLTESIRTKDQTRHPMVGLIPGEAVMCERLQALGYVEIETQADSILGPMGLRFRGHQFRYSELRLPEGNEERAVDRVYAVRRRRGDEVFAEGYRAGSVLASYVHAHWASNPNAARGLVAACAAHKQAQEARAHER
jgi:cobyrinic acid a,c-diamide synthase